MGTRYDRGFADPFLGITGGTFFTTYLLGSVAFEICRSGVCEAQEC